MEVLVLVIPISIVILPAILYMRFGIFKFFYHDVLKWHEPIEEEGFDGLSFTSRCKYCDKKIIQDSQGNWF